MAAGYCMVIQEFYSKTMLVFVAVSQHLTVSFVSVGTLSQSYPHPPYPNTSAPFTVAAFLMTSSPDSTSSTVTSASQSTCVNSPPPHYPSDPYTRS